METLAGAAREEHAGERRFIKSKRDRCGFTLIDLLLMIAVLLILGVILIPKISVRTSRSPPRTCTNNLKQVGLAFRIWADDHQYTFPQALSVTNGGAMEAVMGGNVAAVFQVMSNVINSPKILFCPTDKKRIQALTFDQASPSTGWHKSVSFLGNSNLTYFASLDAKDTSPEMFLSGDDNFLVGGNSGGYGGTQVTPGILSLTKNAPLAWSDIRHERQGNIGLADGSVQGFSSSALRNALANTGVETNRLAMP